ncbi:NAD(P)H-dependent oxidoreductase [Coralliovum pocilloporae]|uniref:NAD(P)H-dependent oxidoreductase n=1 Tax=Coralliovum pocilloporae TaxID=3066369 RepID=UPI0033075395
MAQSILVLFFHPALHRSRVNRVLYRAASDLDNVTFHDLYEAYPDFMIDVHREQDLLMVHDIIVFQHPFFWYSGPALMKEWFDLVLEHDFAFGRNGTALQDKAAFCTITTGGPEQSYANGGYNHYTIPELLRPIEQTVRLCNMNWLPPVAIFDTAQLNDHDVSKHAEDYRRILIALRDEPLDSYDLDGLDLLNRDLSRLRA